VAVIPSVWPSYGQAVWLNTLFLVGGLSMTNYLFLSMAQLYTQAWPMTSRILRSL
jgi:hypothetical protein